MLLSMQQIRAGNPCSDSWDKLVEFMSTPQYKNVSYITPMPLRLGLTSHSVYEVLWCLPLVPSHAREKRLYSVWLAKKIRHLLRDRRSLDALAVAERFANGEVGVGELVKAYVAARQAAWDAYAVMATELDGFGDFYTQGSIAAKVMRSASSAVLPCANSATCANTVYATETLHSGISYVISALYYQAIIDNEGYDWDENRRLELRAKIRAVVYEEAAAELNVLFDCTETGAPYEINRPTE